MDWDLQIPVLEVELGKDAAALALPGKVTHVGNRIFVCRSDQVQKAKVAAGPP